MTVGADTVIMKNRCARIYGFGWAAGIASVFVLFTSGLIRFRSRVYMNAAADMVTIGCYILSGLCDVGFMAATFVTLEHHDRQCVAMPIAAVACAVLLAFPATVIAVVICGQWLVNRNYDDFQIVS